MTNQDIFEKAAIAAMQGIIGNSASNPNMTHIDVISQSMDMAKMFITFLEREKKYNDISSEDYIAQVDENHALIARDLTTRINQLEYKVDYLTQFIEKNYPGWINTPIKG